MSDSAGNSTKTRLGERKIFFDALDIDDAAARRAFLDGACDENSTLRARVEALLKADEDTEFLKPITHESAPRPSSTTPSGRRWTPPTPEDLDQQLPGYAIEAVIGHGGKGAVYRGTQESLERPVAIKISAAGIWRGTGFRRALSPRGIGDGEASAPEHRHHFRLRQRWRDFLLCDGVCRWD